MLAHLRFADPESFCRASLDAHRLRREVITQGESVMEREETMECSTDTGNPIYVSCCEEYHQ